MADKAGSAPRRAKAAARGPTFAKWSKVFLAELAATSNIAAAARKAEVSTFLVYNARRTNPEFNRKWQQALSEGYDHLEMELLHRLRNGEIKPATGAKKGVRTFDNTTAFRQLAVHREAVSRSRAIRDNEDTEAILASIDAKLERMRQRWLAAKKREADAETQAEDDSGTAGLPAGPGPGQTPPPPATAE